MSDESFMRELYGTRAHVESLMSVLGWCRPCDSGANGRAKTEPNAELFLWALLMGRAELAMLFWRR